MKTISDHRAELFAKGPRKVGALMVIGGAFLFYSCAYQPLQDAMSGVNEVKNLSAKGTVAGTALVILGLALLIGGDRLRFFLHPPPEKSKVPSVVFGFLMAGIGFGVFYAVKSHIESLGYAFRF